MDTIKTPNLILYKKCIWCRCLPEYEYTCGKYKFCCEGDPSEFPHLEEVEE